MGTMHVRPKEQTNKAGTNYRNNGTKYNDTRFNKEFWPACREGVAVLLHNVAAHNVNVTGRVGYLM